MNIKLVPINDDNRGAVLALSVREDQPFVAPNDVSLRQYAETEEEAPGVARPFAICADEKPVGFCMLIFDPEEDDEDDRYFIWRFMIDRKYQNRGYG
ncbi:MAG: GNAT family N-acetyltransferase, partial [Clostridia bacterium]|nr:GNAT family N-acetyltransferase [Clostridia bacterium]